jgi:hypothetical protein
VTFAATSHLSGSNLRLTTSVTRVSRLASQKQPKWLMKMVKKTVSIDSNGGQSSHALSVSKSRLRRSKESVMAPKG